MAIRLKICRRLYGNNVRKVGKIYITGNRRNFCIYYKNNYPKYRDVIVYADYKMEKKLGRLLRDDELVHHDNENTLCDKYWNLKVEIRGPHSKYHNLGKILSKETRNKMSISKIGKNNPNFGKIFSSETRRKIGLSKIGKQYSLGIKRSKETRRKISNARKRYWANKRKEL